MAFDEQGTGVEGYDDAAGQAPMGFRTHHCHALTMATAGRFTVFRQYYVYIIDYS